MNFKHLDSQTKEQLHNELSTYAKSIGGTNFFLQLIEDIKKEKPHPLLNKTSIYHYSKGKINWNKSIYKDTLELLSNTIRLEEKDEKFFDTLKPKVQKTTKNMMRALKPVVIEIKPKGDIEGEGFSLNIIDSSDEDDIKISLIYKIIFFYNIDFAKQALAYTPKN